LLYYNFQDKIRNKNLVSSGLPNEVAIFSCECSAASCCQVIGPKTPSKELIMASAMDVDDEEIELPTSSSGKGKEKRFEVKER
jgi:hypothetical protein